MRKKIRVLVIDDSALVRQILADGLNQDPEIEVVGTAGDVFSARDKIVNLQPDVLTLDVEMPRMDGIVFLKKLMPQYPLPVIMVSALTGPGAAATMEALNLGAVDVVMKPTTQLRQNLSEMMNYLIDRVKAASLADVSKWRDVKFKEQISKPHKIKALDKSTDKVIAIGASTGGTVALTQIVQDFPADIPGTVIVQHMPPGFTRLFADKLNQISNAQVKEAQDGDKVLTGRVLIAPGGLQMSIIRSGGEYLVRIREAEKMNGHAPSVDYLFRSIAEYVGKNALGVILTGMGKDGAEGLLQMKQAGAITIGQDEATSIIYGMPREAFLLGAVDKQLPLNQISKEIELSVRRMGG